MATSSMHVKRCTRSARSWKNSWTRAPDAWPIRNRPATNPGPSKLSALERTTLTELVDRGIDMRPLARDKILDGARQRRVRQEVHAVRRCRLEAAPVFELASGAGLEALDSARNTVF